MGTKFTVYDNGVNPQKASSSTLEGGTLRQELAAVCYVSPGSWVSGLQVGCDGQEWLPDLWAVPVEGLSPLSECRPQEAICLGEPSPRASCRGGAGGLGFCLCIPSLLPLAS